MSAKRWKCELETMRKYSGLCPSRVFSPAACLRALVCVACALTVFSLTRGTVFADQLRLADGKVVEVDEAWEDSHGVWYRRGGVTHLLERSRVRGIERAPKAEAGESATTAVPKAEAKVDEVAAAAPQAEVEQTVWIHLKGGAEMEVDEANESAEGVWYRRGNLSVFIERARIERIERDRGRAAEEVAAGGPKAVRRERAWSTGSRGLDSLIRANGARHGVDPYLIFLVIEKESSFNSRAVSPVGARGLMQLMPGTAARFGVRNPNDPAQNISGGTRYLKQLLQMFKGRVDLALAGYNAGEGNVRKFGHRVPPFRETRNYVRTISQRYSRGI